MMILLLRTAAPRLLVAIGLFAIAPDAANACSGQIVSSPNPTADYNPFDPVDHVRSYTVTIENRAAEECAFWLRFEQPAGSGGSSGGFAFQIKSETGGILAASDQPPGSAAALSSGILAPNESYDFHYAVAIPAGQMLASGGYDKQVELRLHVTTGPKPSETAPPSDTASLTLLASVQNCLGINIAGAGTSKTIDFGELTQGESQRVVIEARSNSNFTLRATSTNGGALAMEPPYQDWRIPYTMSVDGGAANFPAEIGPFGVTTIAGHSFDVSFTVGDVSGKRAGLYSDEIIIEIRPAL